MPSSCSPKASLGCPSPPDQSTRDQIPDQLRSDYLAARLAQAAALLPRRMHSKTGYGCKTYTVIMRQGPRGNGMYIWLCRDASCAAGSAGTCCADRSRRQGPRQVARRADAARLAGRPGRGPPGARVTRCRSLRAPSVMPVRQLVYIPIRIRAREGSPSRRGICRTWR